ncbi:unnamed protein product [Camellia sinensis]
MGGGNGQKAKMAREKNMEKMKAAGKGSQLDSNKKAMTIQCYATAYMERNMQVFIVKLINADKKCEEQWIFQSSHCYLQGVYADIHLHYIGAEMQGACRSQASKIRFLYLFPSS